MTSTVVSWEEIMSQLLATVIGIAQNWIARSGRAFGRNGW